MAPTSHLQTTRTAYDAVADLYAELFSRSLETQPLDRAVLAAFAELVRDGGAGPVADLGCGPGHVTAHLRSLGLTPFGVDLSPAMIALARQANPDLRFDEGSIAALDVEDGVLSGIVAWYSVIHTPPEHVPATLAEFHRVLAPGGHLLLGFFHTDDPEPQEFDHKVAPAYRWSNSTVVDLLHRTGFVEIGRMLREPRDGERFQQGRVLAHKPMAGQS